MRSRLFTSILTALSLVWVACVYAFTLLPDDAPVWRGSPVGLAILGVLLLTGALIAHAWHRPELPAQPSMADQAPRIRRSAPYRNRCYPPVKYVHTPARDW